MASLFPTPTRIALLRYIANAQVGLDLTADVDRIILWPNAPTEWQTQQVVTARVREMETAGWIEADPAAVTWHLTVAGQNQLPPITGDMS